MFASLRFRTRLILACSALVGLTTILMIVPLLVSSNDQSESIYRERLTAVAHGASTGLRPDTVELLAATSAPTSIPYIVVRNVLREFSWRTGDTLHVDPNLGILLVVRSGTRYRILAHSDWSVVRPTDTLSWTAPPDLADSLGNLRAGSTSLWWFSDGARLMAVSPVFAGTVPVGLVVASAPRAVATAEMRRVLGRLVWYPVFALALAVGLAILLARQLTRRIERLARQAEVLASGDLRATVTETGNDEFGRLASALRDLADHLRDTLSGMSASASSVAAAVDELAMGAHEMKVSTAQLAAAADAITDSATRQTDGIRSIASLASASATQANAVSEYASAASATAVNIAAITARIGTDSAATLARMTDISKVTAEATPAVAALADKSRRIAVVAQAIAQLADQAQLLSLNASIEAARAGVHGLGFGVVAREVRVLADGTRDALGDIHTLAAEIEELSRRTGKRMDEMQSSVAQGEAVMQASSRSLEEIIVAVEAGRSANREIAEHATLQETRAGDVSAHVAVIGDAALENAGMARQVIAAVGAQSAVATSVAQSTTRLGDVVTQLREALVGFDL